MKTESSIFLNSIFLKKAYRGLVEEGFEKQGRQRRPKWTESIAVGSEDFVERWNHEVSHGMIST